MIYHDRAFADGLAADRRKRSLPIDGAGVERLVRSAAEGDGRAWNELFRRYTSAIRAVATAHRLQPHEADDIVQLTWLRLLEHIDDLRELEKVGGWLRTTARHESCRLLKRARRELPSERLPDTAEDAPSAFETAVEAERAAALQRALERVSPRQRAFIDALLDDASPSYASVADALGVPVGSIGPTRIRTMDRLRNDAVLMAVADPA
jgi:RNA polymerase sigma factor (sigma-70 family)